jgi:hypothetical protein
MKISKTKAAVIYSYEKGYRIINGVIINPDKIPLKGKYVKSKGGYYYHFFSITYLNVDYSIPVHFLVAYEKFKEKLFEEKIQVRHVDGNSINNNSDNILLGTACENCQDKLPATRLKAAKIASSHIHKLNREQSIEFLQDRESGMSYSQLGKKWNMGKSTISCLLNQADYLEEIRKELGFINPNFRKTSKY